ncbi:hypothetical protein GCM10007973_18050 [Polymorphobacter multimanifer]|uniref:DnaJ-class molecular chaperone n=1 Tax=Polymorphobacter multimanifer TaxID=1070431 RepID=A0A841L5W3_9SPHN|nr:hypothetical protein [Polymorphobacter multimanifer]MBB6228319.1 DnaJ-class molecular chaperone [Polymorphobacter multimanifer]GGI82006.1 hypothetical protein GCM10007973_18050 [Polymorphobacter multimanifer]
MSRWLPTIRRGGITFCTDAGEAEGRYIEIEWRGRILQLAIASPPPVSVPANQPCPQCEGEGGYYDGLGYLTCSQCDGVGTTR